MHQTILQVAYADGATEDFDSGLCRTPAMALECAVNLMFAALEEPLCPDVVMLIGRTKKVDTVICGRCWEDTPRATAHVTEGLTAFLCPSCLERTAEE